MSHCIKKAKMSKIKSNSLIFFSGRELESPRQELGTKVRLGFSSGSILVVVWFWPLSCWNLVLWFQHTLDCSLGLGGGFLGGFGFVPVTTGVAGGLLLVKVWFSLGTGFTLILVSLFRGTAFVVVFGCCLSSSIFLMFSWPHSILLFQFLDLGLHPLEFDLVSWFGWGLATDFSWFGLSFRFRFVLTYSLVWYFGWDWGCGLG